MRSLQLHRPVLCSLSVSICSAYMAYITSQGHKRPRRPSHALPGEVRVQKKPLSPELSTVLRHSVLLSSAQFSLDSLKSFSLDPLFGLSSSSVSEFRQMSYWLDILRLVPLLHFSASLIISLSLFVCLYYLFPIFPPPAIISFYSLLNYFSHLSLLLLLSGL